MSIRTETRYVETGRDFDDEVEARRVTRVDDQSVDGTLRAANIVYTISGILTGLIGLRFLLLLLGANSENAIAQIIYGLTQPFVAPFYGLLGTPYAVDGVRFELASVLAIVFIAFIAWVIVKLLTVSRSSEV